MVEEWKDIKGYEGIYKISDLGKVVRIKGSQEHPMKIWNNGRYMEIRLSKGGKSTHFTLHRLLAVHFIPNPDNLPFVNHIDENKLNNSINNPEWCTQVYNTDYGEGRHPIIVLDELSGIETTYPTIRGCIKSLHITARTIYKYIDTGISYKNKKFNHYE